MKFRYHFLAASVAILSISQANAANTNALKSSMDKMNAEMKTTEMTGDPDKDFVKMMVTHHKGAVSMAEVELQNGKDPTIKKMAQKMVDDQQKEIKEMNGWLEKHQ